VSPSDGEKQAAGSRNKVNVKRVQGAKGLGTYGSDPMSMGWVNLQVGSG